MTEANGSETPKKEAPKKPKKPRKPSKPKGSLSIEDVSKMIQDWDKHTEEEFAEMFDVSKNTISLMAKEIRKMNPTACPPKKRRGATRSHTAKEALKKLNMI